MGRLIRSTDWSATPLGPLASWPNSLRIAVSVCLGSRLPMFVWWGPELINLYNDAYAPILGKRHPRALGRPAHETWSDIWDVVGPQADAVMQRGEATWNERVLLVMERHGYAEETYFTWSYSPIRDEAGAVVGLFCACSEDTARVVAERERAWLAEQRQLALDAARMGSWHYDPTTQVARYDARYAEIFGVSGTQRPNADLLAKIHPEDLPRVWAAVEAALDPARPVPYAIEYRIVREDGAVRWIEAHGLPTFAGEGAARRAVTFVGTAADVTERKRAAEQSRTILESITDAFFAVDREWRFTYVNNRAHEVLGHAPGSLLGKCLWDVYPGLAGSEFERVYRRAAEERVAASATAWYPDHARYYEVHAYPAAEGISIYFRDVTARRRAETERDWLAAVVRNSPDFVGIADLDGVPVFANDRAMKMVGMTEFAQVHATRIEDFFVPEDRAFVRDMVLPAAIRDGRWIGELRLLNVATGAALPVLYDVFRIDDPATGRPTHLATITRDMTEARRIADRDRFLIALDNATRVLGDPREITQLSARLLGEHLGVARCLYADIDDAGEYCFVREGYSASGPPLTGHYALRAFGEPFAASMRAGEPFVVDDAATDARLDGVRAAYQALGARAGITVPLHKAGRLVAMIVVHASEPRPWRPAEVDLLFQVGNRCWESIQRAAVERSLRQALEAEQHARGEAEQANRVKDEFLATLSHELRTPLNAILGWSQMIGADPSQPDKLARGLAAIERNARLQAQIVEDLLDMSRIISGKVRLEMQALDLVAVVQSAVETIRPAADAKGVALRTVLEHATAPVRGDPGRLQQVVWNLLSNAVKFTPRGGHVTVGVTHAGPDVEVTVVDSGEGIPADFLPYVFDRFRQADGSSTRRHGGLGLGLSIVKQLVELHGGRVGVRSEGAGLGASFTVSLPLAPALDEAAAVAEDAPRTPALSPSPASPLGAAAARRIAGVRVLVVDDEPDARDLVRQILEDCDAVVSTAASAEEAVARVRAERPDVLVSDLGMPEQDGYALIQRVRALGAGAGGAVPAVALTAYARAEDRTRSMLAGYQMHVPKPVEPAELIATVASLVGRAAGG